MENGITKRLASLDVLRGFDLFMLVFFQPVFQAFSRVFGAESSIQSIGRTIFSHVEWEGFQAWDMVMPLFLFMTGASIPFAFSKFKKSKATGGQMFRRIIKRVFILWVFGAIIQGNLLDLDIRTLHLYTNTLQSIATGYFFAAILYMYLPIRGLIIAAIVLPITYTIGMQIYGNYLPFENMAEVIDRTILGHFVDLASISDNGTVLFSKTYNYAWIYPSLNFTTTVLMGLLTGYLLKSKVEGKKKVLYLLITGGVCIILAYALSPIEPIIKKIWTSTMTLLSGGYSIILMALFYYIIDILGKGKWLGWLKFYGMNSILAYMLYNTLKINSLLTYWLHGLEQFAGVLYPTLITLAHVTVIFFILLYCYKKIIFLKV
ncbi:MAG: acyltransferase family protein [Bacteroidales bacterium]